MNEHNSKNRHKYYLKAHLEIILERAYVLE